MTGPAHDENGNLIPPAFRRAPVPAAYRRVRVPAGAGVHIRAKPSGTPPSLTVEDATGADLLTVTLTEAGLLDVQCDETRLTEAAQRFLVELKSLLQGSTGGAGGRIRVRADDAPEPRTPPP